MPIRLASSAPSTVCAFCRQSLTRSKRRRFASSPSPKPEIYDVVTVGGGPAGLALLAALKSSPLTSHLKTALIETQNLDHTRTWSLPGDRYSNRASSLTPSSVAFLENIESWSHIDQSRIQPYDEMQVWDASNDSSIQFDWKAEATKYNAPPQTVATMVENANLTKSLLERIYALGAESSLFSETSVSSITMGEDDPSGVNLSNWPVVTLQSKSGSTSTSGRQPTALAARLLIGADGVNSPVRNFAGIASHGWDYQRHGVVATLTLHPEEASEAEFDPFSDPAPNRATAYQRFLPSLGGPIAILPLPDNHASLVWSTTPQHAQHIKSLPAASLTHLLNAALRLSLPDLRHFLTLPPTADLADGLAWRSRHTPAPHISRGPPLVASVQEGTVASFPLRFRHAAALTGPRVALLGDAAHTVHPLAGQGLNLGLADAQALSETVAYAVSHGMDIGDAMGLEAYAGRRFGQGLRMAGGVDLLEKLYRFGGGEGPLAKGAAWARGVGMGLVGVVPGLKEAVMRQAA